VNPRTALHQPTTLGATFREFMSSFYTGVTIVTTTDDTGTTHAMTCTSLASVTLEPPTLLVCLDSTSGTLRAILDSHRFAVNILGRDAPATAEFFSSPAPRDQSTAHQIHSPTLAQPWLPEESLAMAECTLASTLVVGTHTVVFGTVQSSACTPSTPLIYGHRSYQTLTEEPPA